MTISQTDLLDLRTRAAELEAGLHTWLVKHSITALRIAMGAVFFGFGVMKYVPGLSPAQNLAVTTTHLLTFGLIPNSIALILVATLECCIGIGLLTGRAMRATMVLLAGELVGILSPVVLLPARLFSGSHHFPTLEGQYVLKDVILVAAAMVLAAVTTGASLVPRERHAEPTGPERVPAVPHRLPAQRVIRGPRHAAGDQVCTLTDQGRTTGGIR